MDILSLTDQDRSVLIAKHPVVTKNYLIITPVITEVYALIRDRVYMRTTGTFMYATPRMGKSTCAKAIKLLLEAEFPTSFIMNFVAESSRKQDTAIFIDILHAANIGVPSLARYAQVQRKLITHIQSELVTTGGDQFVLMIDEMQNLGAAELDKLATIHNRLEQLGIHMTTIGFAQPEILGLRSALSVIEKTYLISRFLCEPIPFNGCTSSGDLEKILNDYDREKFFPEDSDFTYTRFFLPKAFENGFRLMQYAQLMWKELKKAAGEGAESIPMEHLSRTVEFLLVSSKGLDTKDFKINSKLIASSVQASNLRYFSDMVNGNKIH